MLMQPRRIHILPSFHYDVAYLLPYAAYLPIVFRNIDEALRLLEEHPDYRFLLEQVIVLDEYWRRFPEKRALLRKFAREGRLEVAPGMYVMPDMNHPSGESLFQQIRLGRDWLEEHLEVEPRVCWIADCWGHHAQLPQILRQAGYDYYVFWRCMRRDVQKNDFLWRGLDGTSIRTHWLALGYGNVRFPDEAEVLHAPDLSLHGCGPDDVRALARELANYGPSEELLLCNGGDFIFPQAAAPRIVAELNGDGGLPPIRFSTAAEFLDAVVWEEKATVEGEFNSSLQGTFTSNIRVKQHNHRLTHRLVALEALSALVSDEPTNYQEIWRLLLKQQFHDILCGTIGDGALRDCYTEFEDVERQIEKALRDLDAAGGDAAEGTEAYFNALPFARTEILEEGGKRFLLDLPALGFTPKQDAQEIAAGPAPTLPLRFTNAFYAAQVDADGYLVSLIPTATGKEVVRAGAPAFGAPALQMDYGDLWLNFEAPLSGGSIESSLTQNHPDPYDRSKPGEIVNRGTMAAGVERAWVERFSADEVIVAQKGWLSFWQIHLSYRVRFRLARHSPRIDCQMSFTPAGKHYRIRVAFPTSWPQGNLLHEIPFGLIERGEGEHPAQNWVDYGTEEEGLTLFNRGTPGHSLDRGMLLLSLFRSAAMEYKAPSAASFNEGVPHAFHYALMARGQRNLGAIVRQAQSFAQPPLSTRVKAKHLNRAPWELSASNVFISSLRWEGEDLFLRLYEGCGQAAQGTLSLGEDIAAFALAEGLGGVAGPWTPCSGVLPFELGAFAIQGYRLRRRVASAR